MNAKEEKVSAVNLLLETLKEDELECYYESWINKISRRKSKEEMISHLEKHLNEEEKGTWGWIISAVNLMRICNHTFGCTCGENPDIIQQYKGIILGYKLKNSIRKIPTKEKIQKLLRHYINHPETATEPPEYVP